LGARPDFYGRLIRGCRRPAAMVSAAFQVPVASSKGTKTAEIVLGKQHPRTTFLETVKTPKKAAHA
jgi:hypothetical protein